MRREEQKIMRMYKDVMIEQLPDQVAKKAKKAIKNLTLEEVEGLVNGGEFTITVPRVIFN